MLRKIIISFCLLLLLAGFGSQFVTAQDSPPNLYLVIPESAEILNSPDADVRASILQKLVVPVPFTCTLGKDLPFALAKEDYDFVVTKILELDLSTKEKKLNFDVFGDLLYLIGRFDMQIQLEALAGKYLTQEDRNVQATIIYTIMETRARQLDRLLVPLLESTDEFIQRESLRALVDLESPKAVPALIEKLKDSDKNQRHYALRSLVKVNGRSASTEISKLLYDEDINIRTGAIDSLVKLNAVSESAALWRFIEETNDEFLTGFALAALLHFKDVKAVPVVMNFFTQSAYGSGNKYLWEFVSKLRPEVLLPEFISLYYSKERFFSTDEYERNMRRNIYNFLYIYRAKEAIPIYRENLFGSKHIDDEFRFKEGVAQILLELDAKEAVADLIIGFNRIHSSGGKGYDYSVGNVAYYLSRFNDARANKTLIDLVENNKSQFRGSIVANLNQQLDPELWHILNSEKIDRVPYQSLEGFAKDVAEKSGIEIHFEKDERFKVVKCEYNEILKTDSVPCSHADGKMTIAESLNLIFKDRENQNFTWVIDNGEVRILSVEKAVEWWRMNHLGSRK